MSFDNYDGERFLEQNDLAARTLTLEQVEPYAEHHAGGLFVLGQPLGDSHYVKMHDSWGGEDSVVVHWYDTEDVDLLDVVEHFPTGAEALERFLVIIETALLRAVCSCGFTTTDQDALEAWNQYGDHGDGGPKHAVSVWTRTDGFIVIADNREEGHPNDHAVKDHQPTT